MTIPDKKIKILYGREQGFFKFNTNHIGAHKPDVLLEKEDDILDEHSFFVSKAGNDDNEGTRAEPFLTIKKAVLSTNLEKVYVIVLDSELYIEDLAGVGFGNTKAIYSEIGESATYDSRTYSFEHTDVNTIYLSAENGDDTNDGTYALPVASMEKAVELVDAGAQDYIMICDDNLYLLENYTGIDSVKAIISELGNKPKVSILFLDSLNEADATLTAFLGYNSPTKLSGSAYNYDKDRRLNRVNNYFVNCGDFVIRFRNNFWAWRRDKNPFSRAQYDWGQRCFIDLMYLNDLQGVTGSVTTQNIKALERRVTTRSSGSGRRRPAGCDILGYSNTHFTYKQQFGYRSRDYDDRTFFVLVNEGNFTETDITTFGGLTNGVVNSFEYRNSYYAVMSNGTVRDLANDALIVSDFSTTATYLEHRNLLFEFNGTTCKVYNVLFQEIDSFAFTDKPQYYREGFGFVDNEVLTARLFEYKPGELYEVFNTGSTAKTFNADERFGIQANGIFTRNIPYRYSASNGVSSGSHRPNVGNGTSTLNAYGENATGVEFTGDIKLENIELTNDFSIGFSGEWLKSANMNLNWVTCKVFSDMEAFKASANLNVKNSDLQSRGKLLISGSGAEIKNNILSSTRETALDVTDGILDCQYNVFIKCNVGISRTGEPSSDTVKNNIFRFITLYAILASDDSFEYSDSFNIAENVNVNISGDEDKNIFRSNPLFVDDLSSNMDLNLQRKELGFKFDSPALRISSDNTDLGAYDIVVLELDSSFKELTVNKPESITSEKVSINKTNAVLNYGKFNARRTGKIEEIVFNWDGVSNDDFIELEKLWSNEDINIRLYINPISEPHTYINLKKTFDDISTSGKDWFDNELVKRDIKLTFWRELND